MLRWSALLLVAATLLPGVLLACGSDDDESGDAQPQAATSTGELAPAQQETADTQAALLGSLTEREESLRQALAGLEATLQTTQETLGAAGQRTTALGSSLSSAETALALAQEDLAALSLALSDLRDSFLTTRHEVGLNTDAIALNTAALQALQDEISTLQSAQAETAQGLAQVESDLAAMTTANQALQAKIDAATPYANATNAYFDLAGAVTQAAQSAASIALADAVTKTGDPDLQTALEDWLNATTLEQSQLLNIFLDVLGTKLRFSLVS